MAVKWTPSGKLDVSTDPAQLPLQVTGKDATSGSMTRCTNLRLDQAGVARTRWGSTKLNGTAIATPVHELIEMGGARYAFAGTAIYKDEVSHGTGCSSAQWTGAIYNPYNSTTRAIYALNGTDRKRVESSGVYEWGVNAPSAAPTVADGSLVYTTPMERTYHGGQAPLGFAIDSSGDSLSWGSSTIAADIYYAITQPWESFVLTGAYSGATGVDTATHNAYTATDFASSTYGVKYTLCRKESTTLVFESNPSPGTYFESNGRIVIGWPAPSDSQITHVRLYRTLSGGATFYYAGEYPVADLSGSPEADDASLGSEVEVDHDRPPAGTIVAGPDFNGYLFIAYSNQLYFCKPRQPEYWPSSYWVEVSSTSDPIKALRLVNGQLFIMTRNDVYILQGTGYQSFFPIRQSASVGALSQKGTCASGSYGILRFHESGAWQLSSGGDMSFTDMKFRPVFEGEDKGSINGLNTSHAANGIVLQWRSFLYIAFPGGSETYCSEVLRFDPSSEKTVHYSYGRSFSSLCVDTVNDRLLGADADGYVWVIEDSSVTHDDSSDIEWQVESGIFSDTVRYYFPRYAKWDVSLESGSGAFGKVILDEEIVQTHPLRSRDVRKRLVDTSNGKRLSIRITGVGDATIYSAEVE